MPAVISFISAVAPRDSRDIHSQDGWIAAFFRSVFSPMYQGKYINDQITAHSIGWLGERKVAEKLKCKGFLVSPAEKTLLCKRLNLDRKCEFSISRQLNPSRSSTSLIRGRGYAFSFLNWFRPRDESEVKKNTSTLWSVEHPMIRWLERCKHAVFVTITFCNSSQSTLHVELANLLSFRISKHIPHDEFSEKKQTNVYGNIFSIITKFQFRTVLTERTPCFKAVRCTFLSKTFLGLTQCFSVMLSIDSCGAHIRFIVCFFSRVSTLGVHMCFIHCSLT